MTHLIAACLASTALLFPGEPDGHDDEPKPRRDASLRESFFESDVRVTYRPGEGLRFESPTYDYALTLSGRIEAHAYAAARDGAEDELSAAARRGRIQLDGYIYNRDITYLVQTELTQSPAILDAVIGWRMFQGEDAEFGLRIGLQKPRSSLQFETDSRYTEFVERSAATRTFSEARGVAAIFEGTALRTDDGAPLLAYHFGLMNNDVAAGNLLFQGVAPDPTDPTNSFQVANSPAGDQAIEASVNGANEINLILGAMLAPNGLGGESAHMRDFREGDLDHDGMLRPVFGTNFFIGNDSFYVRTLGNLADPFVKVDNQAVQWNAFAAIKTGTGVAAQTEIFLRNDDPNGGLSQDTFGWYGQGSYTTEPGDGMQWGIAGRLSVVTLDRAGPMIARDGLARGNTVTANPSPSILLVDGSLVEFQLGLNAYYRKTGLMTQLMYTFQDVDADRGQDQTNHGIDLLFRLMF